MQDEYKRCESKPGVQTKEDAQLAVMQAAVETYGMALKDALVYLSESTTNATGATLQPSTAGARQRRHKDPPFADQIPLDKSTTKEFDNKPWYFCEKCTHPKTGQPGKWALHPTKEHLSKAEFAKKREEQRKKRRSGHQQGGKGKQRKTAYAASPTKDQLVKKLKDLHANVAATTAKLQQKI